MRHFGLASLGAAVVAGGIAGCYRDPLSGLRGGRSLLVLDHSAVVTVTGATTAVAVSLRDGQGNIVPVADAWWSIADTSVAVVARDSSPVPGNYVARATIVGRARTGGVTTVNVSAGGLAASAPVAVLPAKLDASLITYGGTAHPDTIVRPALLGPPPEPAIATVFTAPDTLVINGTAALQFDTSDSYAVHVQTAAGRAAGYVTSRSPTQLKVVFAVGAAGPLVVRSLLLVTGDSTFGTLRIDSLTFDSVAVSRQHFTGSVTVIGDTLTATAPAGTAFSVTYCGWPSTFCVYMSPASLSLDTATTATLSLSAAQIRLLSAVTYAGPVTVRGLVVQRPDGSAFAFDSLKTNGPYTIAAATLPGTITTGGRLLDTVTVRAAAGASLWYPSITVPATYPCAGCGYGAWVVFYALDSVRFISPVGVNGPILFSGVLVGNATLPMYTRASLVVSGATTGEPNEPGNDSAAGATPLPVGSAYMTYGALNGSTDTTDYYVFQVPSAAYVALNTFQYPGTGAGDAANPRIYAFVCDSLVAGVCNSGVDLAKGGVLLPPGQAWLRVTMRTPTAGYVAYRMSLSEFPTGSVRQPADRH